MIHIAQSEWIVMEVVWEHHPISARGIIDLLAETSSWNEKTIHTLISRLEKKGAIIADKNEKMKMFTPGCGYEDCVKKEASTLIQRAFGGSKKRLITNFLSECEWSNDEIEELKRLVEKLENKD